MDDILGWRILAISDDNLHALVDGIQYLAALYRIRSGSFHVTSIQI